MGSRPSKSKVVPARTRSGLSFVSTSTIGSVDTTATGFETVVYGVQNIIFDDIRTKSFWVGWDPPQNFEAVSYQVRLFPPDNVKSRTLLRSHPYRQHTFTNLHSSTKYSVAIIAIDQQGNKSSCETATVATLPRPPRDLKFIPISTSGSLRAQWRPSKGKPGRYEIELHGEGEDTPTVLASDLKETTKIFRDLQPGKVYVVTVWNVMNDARSKPISDRYTMAPCHVCDVKFKDVTQHEMTLKWKKPDGEVDSYTLNLTEHGKQTEEPVVIKNLTETIYTFNGLTPGRLYKIEIFSNSLMKNKKSVSSKPQIFTQCTVPSEVGGITARDIDPEEAVVTWQPGIGDSDSYDLYLTPKQGVIGSTSPKGIIQTQYKFTGLVPGTVYTVAIVANSKDKISKRAVATFATVPGMIGEIDVSKTERSCTSQRIKWSPACGRTDSYMINLRREDKVDDGKEIREIFKPQYLLKNLTPGTLYEVEVSAIVDGQKSSSIRQTFGTVPAAVSTLTCIKEKCSWDRLFCKWSRAVGGVESFRVECNSRDKKTVQATVLPDLTEYLITRLCPSTSYSVTITALSNGLESYPTKINQTTGPSDVKDLQANSPNKDELYVTWSPPSGGANQYFIKIKPPLEGGQEPNMEHSTSFCHYRLTNLTPGSLYEISVTPFENLTMGKPSSISAYTKPGDVINVHIPEDKVSKDAITVQWWGVEGNSKDVNFTLTRLSKTNDIEDNLASPVVLKEELVATKESGLNEIEFIDLDPDTMYGFRLRAVGKGGLGGDAVFTHSTKPVLLKLHETEFNNDGSLQPETLRETIMQEESATEYLVSNPSWKKTNFENSLHENRTEHKLHSESLSDRPNEIVDDRFVFTKEESEQSKEVPISYGIDQSKVVDKEILTSDGIDQNKKPDENLASNEIIEPKLEMVRIVEEIDPLKDEDAETSIQVQAASSVINIVEQVKSDHEELSKTKLDVNGTTGEINLQNKSLFEKNQDKIHDISSPISINETTPATLENEPVTVQVTNKAKIETEIYNGYNDEDIQIGSDDACNNLKSFGGDIKPVAILTAADGDDKDIDDNHDIASSKKETMSFLAALSAID